MKHVRLVAALVSSALILSAAPAHAAAAKKARYNKAMPHGFKRYNAPGVMNVNRFLYPKREYTGVYTPHVGADSVAGAHRFGVMTGTQPDLVKSFANWGDPFDVTWAKQLWAAKKMPQLEMELWPRDYNGHVSLKAIGDGKADAYIKSLAKSIRAAKVPVAFSLAHEFNGEWYPWGYCGSGRRDTNPNVENACDYLNKPKDFVRAWQRMHKLFVAQKATNAIWMWQANEIGSRPKVDLKWFFPGASNVDWVGVVGYYRPWSKRRTFTSLFGSTFTKVGRLTAKPIVISEFSVNPGAKKPQYVKDFLAGVAANPTVIGFIWFNQDKHLLERAGDYRLEAAPSGVGAYKYGLAHGHFNVKLS
jgi:mannan endo-1,4-beta-mannosidase